MNEFKTIKQRNVSLIDPAPLTIFTPFPGYLFIPNALYVKTKKITGTVTTQPTFKITNGTADVVASAALAPATQGLAKITPTISPLPQIANTHPLTLVKTLPAGGATAFKVDVWITGILCPLK